MSGVDWGAVSASVAAVTVIGWLGTVAWWEFVGRARFRRRCDRYIEHIDYATATRCPCAACKSFRREMGWPP